MHTMSSDPIEKGIMARVEELRNEKGWTKSKLASEVGLTRQIIHNWYAERTRPGGSEILGLARVFGTSVSYLFGETRDRRPAPAWYGDGEGAARADRALEHLEAAARILRGAD